MYKIYAEEMAVTASKLCIYHDAEDLESICLPDPKLTMEDNSAGQLTLTMPPANAGYDSVNRLTTTLTVYKDDVEIWSGRVISEDMDFWNQRSLTCEGELAFLNDSIQPPEEYHIESTVCVEQFLIDLINIHNAQVEDYKKFKVGTVTVHDSNGYLYKYTNYNTTWDCIQEKLLDTYGGHLVITKDSDGTRVLNYYDSYPGTSTQRIEFGKNLLDFTKSWDMTDFATVILPRGAQLEQEVEYDSDGNIINEDDYEYIEALVPYTNLEDYSGSTPVYSDSGSVLGYIRTRLGSYYEEGSEYLGQYVINEVAVSNYGWISVVVDWSDVTEKDNLWSKAVAYLEDIQFDNLQLEINAVDLHYLGADYETINLLDQVVVLSRPHGLVGSDGTGKAFPVSKMDIPLNDPENSTFTFGDKVTNTLTGSTRSANSDVLSRLENMKLPNVSSEAAKLLADAIDTAQRNANNMIARATEGYITIVYDQDLMFEDSRSEALYISNTKDYTEATDFWVWNMGGLAHYSLNGSGKYEQGVRNADGTITPLPNVAINMDGSIFASYITAGVITADLITAGTLTNTTGTFYLDLNNNVLRLGPWTVNNYAFYYGNSSVSSTPSSTSVGPYIYFGTDGLNLAWSPHAYMRVQSGQLTAFGADIITSNGLYSTEMEGGYLKVYYDSRDNPDYGVSSTYLVGGIHAIYWEPNYVQTGYKRMALDISSESNGHFVTLGGVPNNSSTYIVKLLVNSKSIMVYDSNYATYNEDVIVFGSFYASSIRMSDVLQVTLSDNNNWSQSSSSSTIPATLSINIGGAKVSYAGNSDTATKLANSRTISISGSSGSTSASFDGSGNITLYIGSLLPSSSTYTHPDPFEIGTLTVTTKFTANYAYIDYSLWIGGYDTSSSNPYSDYDLTVYAYIFAYGATHLYGNNYFGGGNSNHTENYAQYFYGGTWFYRNVHLGYSNHSATYVHGDLYLGYDNTTSNDYGTVYSYGVIQMQRSCALADRHMHFYPASGNWHMCIGGSASSGAEEYIGFSHCLSSSISGADSSHTYYFLRCYYDTLLGASDVNNKFRVLIDAYRIELGYNDNLTNDIYIGGTNNSNYVHLSGYVTSKMDINVISDVSLKFNIQTLSDDALKIIDNITPVSFSYISDPLQRTHYGYIANEVLEACNGEYGIVSYDEDTGYLSMAYNNLIPLLHLKIKQLEKRIEELEKPIIIEEDD